MTSYDTIVLGCGTMGAATCLELAKSGQRVLGLDRFAPPHEMSEHHGDVRMFRMSYYEDPAYVPWLQKSLEAWQELGARLNPPLIELTGALYMGPYEGEMISGCLRAAREHSLPHTLLDHTQLRQRYPMFQVPANYVGLFERHAGYVWCERAVRAMLDAAGQSPAVSLHTHEQVFSWTAADDHVEVKTKEATYRAEKLIITAGPWSAQMLKGLDVELIVTRQLQAWAMPDDPSPFTAPKFPCWAIDVGDGSLFYGFPALPGTGQIKLARHARGTPVDPSNVDRTPNFDDTNMPTALVRQFLPELDVSPMRFGVCLYTNSPDGHYIIDRYPAHPNVAFGCGFSGHGFKMAPAVGQILSQLTLSPQLAHPEPFFSLARLTGSGGKGSGGAT